MSCILDELGKLMWQLFKFILWVFAVLYVIGGLYTLIRDFINSF